MQRRHPAAFSSCPWPHCASPSLTVQSLRVPCMLRRKHHSDGASLLPTGSGRADRHFALFSASNKSTRASPSLFARMHYTLPPANGLSSARIVPPAALAAICIGFVILRHFLAFQVTSPRCLPLLGFPIPAFFSPFSLAVATLPWTSACAHYSPNQYSIPVSLDRDPVPPRVSRLPGRAVAILIAFYAT
ncbi:hypothetical protein BS50DRAFT_17286 [Corynespora cassiicola Philippines]|uniref:Uncharacterized protein n=1 Tax=Corynespora cassiicola Philippines TaxID=1448308 RepID=A0A2T2P9Z6_CORCC|nr:hypothetical protein BS50DRAFT_17286 [Corynespora cassiicola Philippines]